MKGLRLIRLFALVVIALATLLAVALAVLVSVDLSAYRGPLEARVSQALGRQVMLTGPIRVEPSLWPTLTVRGVSIAAPRWAAAPRLAEAERLSLQFALAPLLRGRLQIRRVILLDGRLHLETQRDGTANWMLAPAGEQAGPGPVRLPQIEVRRSTVDFRDGRSGVVTYLGVAAALISAEEGRPTELAVDGTLRGRPLTVGLSGGSLGALVQGQAPWPLRLAVVTGTTRIEASGELHRLPELRFELRLHASGLAFESLGGLIGVTLPPLGPFQLDARFARDGSGYRVSEARGHLGAENSDRRFLVREAAVVAPFEAPVSVESLGTFRGLPFHLTATAAPYPRLLTGSGEWPLQTRLQIAHTQVSVDGVLSAASGDFIGAVQAAGEQLRSLEPLVGRALPALGPYSLTSRLHREGPTLTLSELVARVGDSDASGELRIALAGARPAVSGRLASATLALEDLQRIVPPDRGLDPLHRVLPAAELRAVDLALEVSIDRVLGAGRSIERLRTRLSLQEGNLLAEDIALRLAGVELTGRLAYQGAADNPAAQLEAHGSNIDYGPLLTALGLGNRLQGRAERLDFSLSGTGRTLLSIWEGADLTLLARRGTLVYTGATGQPRGPLWVEQGQATRSAGGVVLHLQGLLREQPYTLELRGDDLAELADDTLRWRMRAAGALEGVDFSAEGTIQAVSEGAGVDLRVSLAGARLAALGPVLGRELPALGRFQLSARLSDVPHGWRLQELNASIGKSDIGGAVRYVGGALPRVEAVLTSRSLRMADLEPAAAAPEPVRETGRLMPDYRFPVEPLRSLELDLTYRAERVALHRGELRNLAFQSSLHEGRLQVQSFSAEAWGGMLGGTLALDASQSPPQVSLSLAASRLSYTQALGALGATGIADGQATLALDVQGQGAALRDAVASARGVVEFYGEGTRIDNRFLKWWGSDLFAALLPTFGNDESAELRCAAGRFDLREGQAETKSLLFDFDRVAIKGVGQVNLGEETLDLLLWPESRDRSAVSLNTPVRVTGPVSAPSVSAQPQGVAENVAWLLIGATNPYVLLLGYLKASTVEDGPCVAALAASAGKGAAQENVPPNPFSKIKDFFRGIGRSFTRPFSSE